MNPELITCFLIGHPKIKGLTLNPFPGAQFPFPDPDDPSNGLDMVMDCISSMQYLRYLSLGHIFYDSLTLPLNCLSGLSQLRSLELKVSLKNKVMRSHTVFSYSKTSCYLDNHDFNCIVKLSRVPTKKQPSIYHRLTQLQECLGATDSSLRAILSNATELESLTIVNCAKICDYSSICVCSNLKQLTVEKSVRILDTIPNCSIR